LCEVGSMVVSNTMRATTKPTTPAGTSAAIRQPPCHFHALHIGTTTPAIPSANMNSMNPLMKATSPPDTGSFARRCASARIRASSAACSSLTHRGLASAFVVVSGHAESAFAPVLETLAPQSLTVVVLMGLASRARLAGLLLEHGWSPSTPAAVLFAAGSEDAHTWRGTLDTLGRAAPPEALAGAPGTIVIGDVVSLADVLAAPSADEVVAEDAFEGGQHAHRR